MSSGNPRPLCVDLSKPSFSEEQATELVERRFGFKVCALQPLPSYDDQNFHVRIARKEAEGSGEGAEECVLKISNAQDSREAQLIEAQTRIMMFLNQEGFPVATPRLTTQGHIMFLETVEMPGVAPKGYMVRLLSFLPGQTAATLPVDPPVLYQIGRLAARLDKTLAEKFHHPLTKSLHRGEFIWNLANVPLLKRYLCAVGQSSYLDVVKQVIEQFDAKIVPKLSSFRPCINHGDLNDHNILIEADSSSPGKPRYRVSGILDFSDMSHGYFVFEVAIAIMYMMIESQDPLRVGGHVLAGFESVVPLTPEERAALFLLVSGRFVQSLVMAAHTSLQHPENKDYLMITAKTGWKHLVTLSEAGQEAVEKVWFETAKAYDT